MHVLQLAQVGMLLVNVCVHDTCCSKSLLCWTILQSDEDCLTLAKFYETVSIISFDPRLPFFPGVFRSRDIAVQSSRDAQCVIDRLDTIKCVRVYI